LKDRDFLHFRELKRELGIGTSSLKWHLRVLEDFKIIHHQKVGQYEIFFLKANAPNYEFLEIYFAIISGIGFRVANSFLQMNSWHLDTLTEYLGYSKEAIRYHLRNFEKIHLLKPIDRNKYYINAKKIEYLKKAISRRKKTN
jgi:predicted transcriptional regulator